MLRMKEGHPTSSSVHTEFSHLHRFSSDSQYLYYMKSIFKREKEFLSEIFLQLAKGSKILPLNYVERDRYPATHFEMFLVVQGLAKRRASYDSVDLIKEAFGFNIITYFKVLFEYDVSDESISDLILDISKFYDLRSPSINSFKQCILSGVDPDSMEDYFSMLTSNITPVVDDSSSSSEGPRVFDSIHSVENRPSVDVMMTTNDPHCGICTSEGEVKINLGGLKLDATVGLCNTLEYIKSVAPDHLPDAALVVAPHQFDRSMTVVNREVRRIALTHGKYIAESNADLFNLLQSNIKCYLIICTSPCVLPYVDYGYVSDCKNLKTRILKEKLSPRHVFVVKFILGLLDEIEHNPPIPRQRPGFV